MQQHPHVMVVVSMQRESVGQQQQTGGVNSNGLGQVGGMVSNIGDCTPSQRGEGLEVGDSVMGCWFEDRRWYVVSGTTPPQSRDP